MIIVHGTKESYLKVCGNLPETIPAQSEHTQAPSNMVHVLYRDGDQWVVGKSSLSLADWENRFGPISESAETWEKTLESDGFVTRHGIPVAGILRISPEVLSNEYPGEYAGFSSAMSNFVNSCEQDIERGFREIIECFRDERDSEDTTGLVSAARTLCKAMYASGIPAFPYMQSGDSAGIEFAIRAETVVRIGLTSTGSDICKILHSENSIVEYHPDDEPYIYYP